MRTTLPSGTVTFLFTDIEGSTHLLETLRDRYEALITDHHRIFRSIMPRWQAHEIETQGDSFFIAFPRAIDAVNFCIETQRSLAGHLWPNDASVMVRMGLHTGEPLVSQNLADQNHMTEEGGNHIHPSYIGMDVHRAARIAAAGHGGQVLLSQTTRDLIYQDLPDGASLRNLGIHTLKDIRLPQQIYQLVIKGLPSEFPPLNSLASQTEVLALNDSILAAPPTEAELEVYRGLLKRWRAQGRQTLDKASLAVLLGAPDELNISMEDLIWVIRSALHEQIDLEPWLLRAESPSDAVKALEMLLAEDPKAQQRLTIVKALGEIQEAEADEILLRVVATDESNAVCTRAALSAASRGRLADVQRVLAAEAGREDNSAPMAALIAIIDEYGSLPPEINGYPKLPVMISVIQRRWIACREAFFLRSRQAAIGGGLALAILGALLPLLGSFFYPADFKENIETYTLLAWIIAGVICGLVWGGFQGLATGAAVGLADVISTVRTSSTLRFVIAGLSGWAFTLLMILFSSAELLSPHQGPTVYVPVFIIYGFLQAGALSWVIPRLGEQRSLRKGMLRALGTSLFIGVVAIPAIYIVYQEGSLARLSIDWLYALLLPAGLALAVRTRPPEPLQQT